MKKLYKQLVLVLTICTLNINFVSAQNLGDAAAAAEADATTYLGNFFEPIIVSASNGLANGWNNTAQPHKLFGFDITLTTSIAGIPESAYNFTFDNNDYSSLRLTNGTSAEVPTIAGGDPEAGVLIEVLEPSTNTPTGQTFAPLSGLGLEDFPVVRPGVPIPMANIGLGLPKGTELRVRFVPVSNVGTDVSVDGSFGVGVLHDVKQWIPGMKLVPIDISAFLGYNQFKFSYVDADGNNANFSSKATTFSVLASKKLLFFTPFIGAGFNAINSDFDFTATDSGSGETVSGTFAYDNIGGGRFQVGARLKFLWVFALSVDYTYQRYNTFNVGLGINFR